MPSAVHRKKGSATTFGQPIEGYSPASQKVAQILRRLESEILLHYNAGDAIKRNKSLVDYCQIANEAAQSLNLQDKDDQKTALKILDHCVAVLE